MPKIIQDPTPQRFEPSEPQQLAEQLVEVPVPSVREVTIMAPFVDTAGRTWYWLSGPDGRHAWYLAGTQHVQRTRPEDRQPRAVYKYWARMMIFHSLIPGSHCSVLVLPEVHSFMDFSGRRLLVCFPYSVLLGSTVDTRLASVYEAFGRISRSSRVFLWEMTSGLSPYSALSLVRQRIHGQRYADEGKIHLLLLTVPRRSVRCDVVWW